MLVVNRLKLNVSKSLCTLIVSCQRASGLNLTITDTRRLERLHSKFTSSVHLLVIPIYIYPCLKDMYFTKLSKFLKLSTRFVLLIYMILFHLLWTLLAILVGTSKDDLFLELELIMVNGYWHTGGQPSGTDYHQHFIVLNLWQYLRNCIACCNYFVLYVLLLYFITQGIAKKQPFGWCYFSLNKVFKKWKLDEKETRFVSV